MNLKVLLPTEVLVDEPVRKVTADAYNGHFCLLPNHIDFVSALVPGLLFYQDIDGNDKIVAIDEGVLVKVGPDVRVSTQNAVAGGDPFGAGAGSLGSLHQVIEEKFKDIDERELTTRNALAHLEAELVRRLIEFKL